MSDTIKFQCDLDIFNTGLYGLVSNAPVDTSIPLGFEVLLDGHSMFKTENVTGPNQISFEINDDEATHKLQFIMTGKNAEHTKIDDNNNITSDVLLKLFNITIDDISIDQFLTNLIEYVHNFNGSENIVTDKFYGNIGCNGTLTLEFTTPFYLWLLEHM